MKGFVLSIAAMCVSILALNAQGVFGLNEIKSYENKELSKKITTYKVFEFDSKTLYNYRKKSGENFSVQLTFEDGYPRVFNLFENDVRSEDYILQTNEKDGQKILERNLTSTFAGELTGEAYGSSRFTIDENFITAFWKEGESEYYLEPLWRLDPSASRNQYVFYELKSVVVPHGYCGVETATMAEKKQELITTPEKNVGECLEVDIALAADFQMVQEFGGSVASVESFILGVLANVQTNYDDEFDNELRFVVSTIFIASSIANDPWTNSNNAGTVLDDFVDWGNGGGFGVASYDVASIWTNRNFTGTTIGVAYLNGICTSLRYGAIENFSNSSALLRVVWAHELGHNFNSGHDSSGGFIMSPSVNNTTTWSGNSQNSINNYVASRSCLSACPNGGVDPPEADFSFSTEIGCAPLEVDFYDESTGGEATLWEWDLPGGDPDFVTTQNATTTYFNAGTYDASLYVENTSGGDTYSESQIITVLTLPNPDFETIIDGFVLDIFNTSTDADSYEWEFGDGGFSSSSDPIYTYTEPGEYEVTLTAFNDCGSETLTMIVVIESTLEAAIFTSETEGCAPLVVEFFDDSEGNTTSWEWEFPGGNPEFSTDPNPVITYPNAGSFDVSFTVGNGLGETDMISFSDLIVVMAGPTADFSVTVNPGEQTPMIVNNSSNADTFSWTFGDGGTSSEETPSHTYDTPGEYIITLLATNECGTDETSHTVVIEGVVIDPSFTVSSSEGCAPHTVQFSANPQSDGLSYNWTFLGGNPTSSTLANPSVTYNSAGSYDVSLTITNAAGEASTTQENAVVVNSGPTAEFVFSNTPGSTSVSFTNQSTNGDSFQWGFGDDQTSISENPSHDYAEEGTYSVTLTTSNDCGSDTYSLDVEIVLLPQPAITVGTSTGCAPLSVDYVANPVGDQYTYEWTFLGGNPASSTDANPSVIYAEAGSYGATLVVTNAAGPATTTQQDIVVVTEEPVAGFIAENVVGSGMVSFSNTSMNANSWHWDFGDNEMSTMENPSHTYSDPGTYTVVLTVSNECGEDVETEEIEIVFSPNPSIGVSSTTGCAPLEVSYSASPSGSEYSYEWTFPGGNPGSSTDANPSVTYTEAGSYGATLVVTNAAGSNTSSEQNLVLVSTIPTALFVAENEAGSGSVSFTNQSTNASSWEWNFGDDQTSSLENPTHVYSEAGTYTVTLTATNTCGDDIYTSDVNIVFLAEPSIEVSNITGCAPLAVAYSALPVGAEYSYAWTFPGGEPSSSTAVNPVVTYNQQGIYGATLIVTNAAGSSMTEQENIITVDDVPEAEFTFSSIIGEGTIAFTNQTINGDSWLWDFGDDQSSMMENPNHSYTEAGTYSVSLTAINECGSNTYTLDVTISAPPEASITASRIEGCQPLFVNFLASPIADGNTYTWTFPGGEPATSSLSNPIVTYSDVGTFEATLTVSNATGSSSTTQNITVLDEPTADFGFTINGLTATFENNSIGAETYEWTIDEAVLFEENPTYEFPSTGTYEVILVAANDCGMDETSVMLTIEGQIPSLSFTTQNNEGCGSLDVSFVSEMEGADDFLWTFEGGSPSSSVEMNPTVNYSEPGVYTATLSASNVYGSNVLTQVDVIVVYGPTIASFDIAMDGATANFQNTSTAANEIEWTFSDGSTSIDSNPSLTFPGNGTYDIILNAEGNCNNDVITQTVVVDGQVSISDFSMNESDGCMPFTVTFTDESTNDPSSWQWSFPGGNPESSTDQNVTVTYTTAGVFDVFLGAANEYGGSQIGNLEAVTVVDEPVIPEFTVSSLGGMSGDVVVNNPDPSNTYHWDFGNGDTATGTSATYTYTETGSHVITLTASNNCGEASANTTIDIIIDGVSTPAWANNLSIFPNPTNGLVNLEATGWPVAAKVEYSLVNVLGQLIDRNNIDVSAENWSYSFDWQYLPAGTYMLQLNWGGEVWTEKLIILAKN